MEAAASQSRGKSGKRELASVRARGQARRSDEFATPETAIAAMCR